jgi:hypothetical protein
MAAGRAWATGPTRPASNDGALSDAAALGLDLSEADLVRPAAEAGIWAWLRPAIEAFAAVSTQWRTASLDGAVIRTGLDYGALRAAWELAGIEATATLFEDVRAIEAGALEAMVEARR